MEPPPPYDIQGIARSSEETHLLEDETRSTVIGFGPINKYNYSVHCYESPVRRTFGLDGIQFKGLKRLFFTSYNSPFNALLGLAVYVANLMNFILSVGLILPHVSVDDINGNRLEALDDNKIIFLIIEIILNVASLHLIYSALINGQRRWGQGSWPYSILNFKVPNPYEGCTFPLGTTNMFLKATRENIQSVAAFGLRGPTDGAPGSIDVVFAQLTERRKPVHLHIFKTKW